MELDRDLQAFELELDRDLQAFERPDARQRKASHSGRVRWRPRPPPALRSQTSHLTGSLPRVLRL